ncbi:MAG: invasion associated locus B family protein [Pseudomonadota bacterium]
MGKAVVGSALGLAAAAAQAQESSNRVAAERAWSVFVEDEPTECWIVSAPTETVNTRDGRVVAVRRGDIAMFVSYRPDTGVEGEVSFKGGYPFAEGSIVTVQISGTSFEMFTSPKDETAWPPTPADDARLTTAMKRGAEAIVTGRSGRGTNTRDTFSLLGFTAALEEAEKRCGA